MSQMISITNTGAMIAASPITIEDYINITLSGQLNLFNDMVLRLPEEEQAAAKETLYDLYNRSASAFLETFAPEIEMRPDLTAEAILKAENEILAEEVVE